MPRLYLIKLHRGPVVERRRIIPHNEDVLLLRGLPSSVISIDAAVQPQDPPSIPQPAAPPASLRRTFRRRSPLTPICRQACVARPPLARAPPTLPSQPPRWSSAISRVRPFPIFFMPTTMRSSSSTRACTTAAPSSMRPPLTPRDCMRLAAMLSNSQPPTHECFKATADIVLVQTDAGMQEYRVPATHAQRERAPDALEWRNADEAALSVLLNTPGRDSRRNVLVPVTKPERLGQPLLPSVLQRRIKTDPVSRRLVIVVKRKSRLCVAGDRQKAIQQATGTYLPRQSFADAADDILIKMVVADSAGAPGRPAKRRVKIDVGNAYGRGRRTRPPAYMRLGTSLRREDDAGVELCLELNTG